MIIAGIDPSLTSTGIAVVDTGDRVFLGTSRVGSKGHLADSWASRAARIARGGVCARIAWAGPDAEATVQVDGWPTETVTIPQVAAILAASDAVEGVVS